MTDQSEFSLWMSLLKRRAKIMGDRLASEVMGDDKTDMNDHPEFMNNRQFLSRILHILERVERKLSQASEYMTTALSSLDDQMVGLQARLVADAEALQAALDAAQVNAEDDAALRAAADRVKATADLVGGLAQPSAVVDEDQPDVGAEPIPEPDENQTTPAPEPETGEPSTDLPSTDEPTTAPEQSLPGVPAEGDPSVATPGDPRGV